MKRYSSRIENNMVLLVSTQERKLKSNGLCIQERTLFRFPVLEGNVMCGSVQIRNTQRQLCLTITRTNQLESNKTPSLDRSGNITLCMMKSNFQHRLTDIDHNFAIILLSGLTQNLHRTLIILESHSCYVCHVLMRFSTAEDLTPLKGNWQQWIGLYLKCL